MFHCLLASTVPHEIPIISLIVLLYIMWCFSQTTLNRMYWGMDFFILLFLWFSEFPQSINLYLSKIYHGFWHFFSPNKFLFCSILSVRYFEVISQVKVLFFFLLNFSSLIQIEWYLLLHLQILPFIFILPICWIFNFRSSIFQI